MIRLIGHRGLFSGVVADTTTAVDFKPNIGAIGVTWMLNVTVAGTSLDVNILVQDPTSGTYHPINGLGFSGVTSTGGNAKVVYPGITDAAGESLSAVLPGHDLRVEFVATGSFTFTFAADWLG